MRSAARRLHSRVALIWSGGIPTLGPRPWRLAGRRPARPRVRSQPECERLVVLRQKLFAQLSCDVGPRALKSAEALRGCVAVGSPQILVARRRLPGRRADRRLPVHPVGLVAAGENSWNRHWADSTSQRDPPRHSSASGYLFNWGFLPPGIRSLGGHHLARVPVPRGARFAACVRVKPWSWLILGRPVSFYYQGGGAFAAAVRRIVREARFWTSARRCCGGHSFRAHRLAGHGALAHRPGLARGCHSRRVRRRLGRLVAGPQAHDVLVLTRTPLQCRSWPSGSPYGAWSHPRLADTRPVVDPSDRASILADRRR